jgi:hypothetical protein
MEKNKKACKSMILQAVGVYYKYGRDDWIRTSGPHVPNVMRYRAAPHPEINIMIVAYLHIFSENYIQFDKELTPEQAKLNNCSHNVFFEKFSFRDIDCDPNGDPNLYPKSERTLLLIYFLATHLATQNC